MLGSGIYPCVVVRKMGSSDKNKDLSPGNSKVGNRQNMFDYYPLSPIAGTRKEGK